VCDWNLFVEGEPGANGEQLRAAIRVRQARLLHQLHQVSNTHIYTNEKQLFKF